MTIAWQQLDILQWSTLFLPHITRETWEYLSLSPKWRLPTVLSDAAASARRIDGRRAGVWRRHRFCELSGTQVLVINKQVDVQLHPKALRLLYSLLSNEYIELQSSMLTDVSSPSTQSLDAISRHIEYFTVIIFAVSRLLLSLLSI